MRDVADRLIACAMRARNEGLTASGLLIARETEAVETPARAATARIPCFSDLTAGGFMGSSRCNVT